MSELSFPPQFLPNRAVIRVTGQGTLPFLHNLLTCNVDALQPGQWAYGALLSPQGKILHDLFVLATTDGACLDCDAGQAEALKAKLQLYRLRAKLNIALDEGSQVVVSPDVLPDGGPDPRLGEMGHRAIRPKGLTPRGDGYDAWRLALGVADSAEIGSNGMFPHEANLDQLNGLSFTKGCYIGQEVVSRMKHRGTARSRILPLAADAQGLQAGAAVHSGETRLGEILGIHANRALALLRLDKLADATAPLLSGSVRLHVSKPGWLGYEVTIPEAAK